MNGQTPTALSIIICDHVIKEEGTGKWSLIGVFDGVRAPQFPYPYHQLYVYINFTKAQGRYQLRLEVVDLDEDITLGQMQGDVEASDISDRLAAVFTIQYIEFPHAGEYAFRIWANDSLLAERIFHVVPLGQPAEE